MKIEINNIEEMILASVALAIELPYSVKPEDVGIEVSEKAFRGKIFSLKKEGALSMRKDTDVIRLKSPEGINKLSKFSQELTKRHACITSKNHTVKGGTQKRQLVKAYSESILYMLKKDAYIDNIKLSYSPNIFGKKLDTPNVLDSVLGTSPIFLRGSRMLLSPSAEIMPLESLCSNLPCEGFWYYSSRLIKALVGEGGQVTRIDPSRFSGMLFSCGNSYAVYYIDDPSARHSSVAEERVKQMVAAMHRNAFGEAAYKEKLINHPKGQAIYICKNESDAKRLFFPDKSSKRTINPLRLYDDGHIILDNCEGDLIFRIITMENFRQEVRDALYFPDEQVSSFGSDGIIEGLNSYEFITSNFGKVRLIKETMQSHVHIICFPWQKEIISRLLRGVRVSFLELNNDQINELNKKFPPT